MYLSKHNIWNLIYIYIFFFSYFTLKERAEKGWAHQDRSLPIVEGELYHNRCTLSLLSRTPTQV